MNFRVGPDEEDGDERARRRKEGEREEERRNHSRILGVLLRKGEFNIGSLGVKRYQRGREYTKPFAPRGYAEPLPHTTSVRIISYAAALGERVKGDVIEFRGPPENPKSPIEATPRDYWNLFDEPSTLGA